MSILEPYQYKTGYIYLPISPDLQGLNTDLELFGDTYHLKSTFHVSLVCVKNIVKVDSTVEEKVITVFNNFIKDTRLNDILFLPEYRLVSHSDGRKSFIQMVTVKNIELLFEKIRKELNIQIDTQPTHVTIYTLQKDKGIGVNTQEDYQNTFEIKIK